ncbi:MAG TPA: MFS transporter [Ktedonobacterales bacterium]
MSANTTTPRLAALRHRDFRLFWGGELISSTGSQMQVVAINWHVYQLLQGTTYTPTFFGHQVSVSAGALGLGLLGLVRVFPIITFALLGGLLADRFDRRKLILWCNIGSVAIAAVLAAITLTGHITLIALYLLTAAGIAIEAFDEPAQNSLVPQLVPREHLTNAVSLNSLIWMIGTIIGPALAGVTIAHLAIGLVYALNALSFVAVFGAVWALRYRGQAGVERSEISWRSLAEGLRFVRGTRLIWGTMLVDFYATFFSSARTMLPIVADRVLHVGVQGYGLLATAQPVGAVSTGVILSLRRDVRRQGLTMLGSVAAYGLATALFGLSPFFALSYLLFGLTGAGDTVSTIIRATIRHTLTPDYVRGRMSSIHMLLADAGPQLGELEAGLVAAFLGAPFAIVTGGLATFLLTGWIAWRWAALRRYTSPLQEKARSIAEADKENVLNV